jgi:hypothetical protein
MESDMTKRANPVPRVTLMEALAPPLPPAEIRRRSLLNAMFGAMSDESMDAIIKKQIEKAEQGDSRAMDLLTKLVLACPPQAEPLPTAPSGREEVMLTDVRENLVRVIAAEGPQRAPALAAKIHGSLECVLRAMDDHHWFEKKADGWHITKQGRDDVLGKG